MPQHGLRISPQAFPGLSRSLLQPFRITLNLATHSHSSARAHTRRGWVSLATGTVFGVDVSYGPSGHRMTCSGPCQRDDGVDGRSWERGARHRNQAGPVQEGAIGTVRRPEHPGSGRHLLGDKNQGAIVDGVRYE